MTCPKCHFELETEDSVCPECGVRLMRSVSGIMKTSAVMIATAGERGFYSSVKDVPEPLRTQLLETTASSNSGTIIIADRAGKEQLTQAMARRESAQSSVVESKVARQEPPRIPNPHYTRQLAWAALVLILLIALAVASFFYLHW